MNRIFIAMLLALGLAATALSGAAFAQTATEEPQAPVKQIVVDGRVTVYAATPRVAGYSIGDSIPVRVVFELTPDALYKNLHPVAPDAVAAAKAEAVKAVEGSAVAPEPLAMLPMPLVHLEGLKMKVQTNQPSDVEMLEGADIKEFIRREDGVKLVVVTFYVTSYVTTQKTQVGVVADFMYAISKLPDGQPNYVSASTPEMIVGIARSATETQTKLIEPDLSNKPSPKAPAAFWALALSGVFAVPLLAGLAIVLYRRATAEREHSKNEKTWAIFNQVFADAERSDGFTLEHYRRIYHALREHFGVLGLDTTQTLHELGKRPDLDAEAVDFVFNRETMFFAPGGVITAEQHDRLVEALHKLIPAKGST